MTDPRSALADRTTPAEPPAGASRDGRGATLLAGLISGAILYLAFPTIDRGYLAWFALVPLLSLVRRDGPSPRLYLAAWLGGLAFWVPSVSWIWELHPTAWLAWLALALYLSLYWPLFLLLTRRMVGRLGLPLMLAAPITWVGLEYLQSFAFTGLPWYFLAHSQYLSLPLIQISDLGGAWLVSLLVMLGNVYLLELVTRPIYRKTARGARLVPGFVVRTAAVGLALGASLLYGFYRLNDARFADGPRVALLQSSIPQELKVNSEPSAIIARYAALIRRAQVQAEIGPPIDLFVWPETSFAGGAVQIEPALSDAQIDAAGKQLFAGTQGADWLARQQVVARDLNDWGRDLGGALLIGALLHDLRASGGERSNAAMLYDPAHADPAIYRKLHLVPFGEYVPLIDRFPWITRLTPYENEALPSLLPGSGPVWFDFRGTRYAPIICFEDTVPDLVRDAVKAAPDGREADVLVAISNDGWFRGSAEHDVHLAVSVFRAIENRIPLIRSVNSGISAVVDGNGRIRQRLAKLQESVLVEVVPLDPRTSLYGRIGDSVALALFAITLGLTVLGLTGWRPRRLRRPV